MKKLPSSIVKTLTYNNGPENTYHVFVNRRLGTDSYFCHPYHGWEKGTVENTIGIVRRFYPKGTNFVKVSDKEIQKLESWLNNRPRKRLQDTLRGIQARVLHLVIESTVTAVFNSEHHRLSFGG